MTAGAHHLFKHSLHCVEPDGEQWEYWQSCVMNKPGCLSILARRAPRQAVASWKTCIVFLSCARARFLWRSRVKRWPPASCKSHGDEPATSPGASPPATEQPPWPPLSPLSSPHLVLLKLTFSFFLYLPLTLSSFILLSFRSLLLYCLVCHLLPVLLLHVSLCPHLLSSLHPFFPPPFVPLSRSGEGLSGVSCASRRSRPHLVRGFLQLPSAMPYRNKKLMSAYIHGATVHT